MVKYGQVVFKLCDWIDRQTDRQTDRETERQTERQRDRQTNKHTHHNTLYLSQRQSNKHIPETNILAVAPEYMKKLNTVQISRVSETKVTQKLSADILHFGLSVSAADRRTKFDGNTPVFPRSRPRNQPSSSCTENTAQ